MLHPQCRIFLKEAHKQHVIVVDSIALSKPRINQITEVLKAEII